MQHLISFSVIHILYTFHLLMSSTFQYFNGFFFENFKLNLVAKGLSTVLATVFGVNNLLKNYLINLSTMSSKQLLLYKMFFNVSTSWCRAGKISFQAHHYLGVQFYLHAQSCTQKNVRSKLKCTSDRDKARDIALCSLLPKQHLELPFLICFHQTFLQGGFCSLNLV